MKLTKLKYQILSVFFILASNIFWAQSITALKKIDSLKTLLKQDSSHIFRNQKLRPFFNIDQRYSWIKNLHAQTNIPIYINGLQMGVILKEKHTVGIGLYNITKYSKKLQKISDKYHKIRYQNLDLKYFTLFYNYVVIDKRFFELDVSAETGLGNYDYFLSDSVNRKIIPTEAKGTMYVGGGGINIILKPLKWLGINGNAGYRVVSHIDHLNLNGIYYSYGIWLDIREIIRETNYFLIKKKRYKKQVKKILSECWN